MSRSARARESSGSDASPHLHFDTATSRLWLDMDGNGDQQDPILVATLKGITTLDMSDFIIV